MRITIGLSAALLALGSAAAPSRTALAQASASSGTKVSAADARAQTRPTTYLNEPSAFVVGRTVYLRSTKTRIGTIEAVDSHHAFPRKFPRSRMRAVLIHRKDGPMEWTPIDGITRIYVVGK
jgi:hypothetical protein